MPIVDQRAAYEHKSEADNPIYQAILASPQYMLEPGQERMYFSEWLSHHTEVFKDGQFLCADGSEAKLVIIFAGVGSGKTTLATIDLPKYGKVLFNCSRNMIRQQQEKNSADQHKEHLSRREIDGVVNDTDLIGNAIEDNPILFTTSWGLINPRVFSEAQKCKYIVVDEAHHLFSDTFCDAPNYLDELINTCSDGQTIILMTACADFLTKAFGIGYDLPQRPVCVIDARSVCYNLQPKEIKIVTRSTAEHLLTENSTNAKRLYFCNTASRAYNYAAEMRENGRCAVAVTSSPQLIEPIVNRRIKRLMIGNDKPNASNIVKRTTPGKEKFDQIYSQSREISLLKNLQDTALESIEAGNFPEDADILFSTSKLREGINIKRDAYQREVFTECLNQVDLVQICGRFRNPPEKMDDPNIDTYYIVVGNIMRKQEIMERSGREVNSDYDQELIHNGAADAGEAEASRYFDALSNDLQGASDEYTQSLKNAVEWQIKNYSNLNEYIRAMNKPYRIHAAQIKKVYTKLNSLSEKPGLFWCKMNRGYYDEIESYSIEKSRLWEINNAIIMDDHRLWNHTNILDEPYILPLVEYVERTFDGVPVEVIDPRAYRETAINIVKKYEGLLLDQKIWAELQKELVACGFVFKSNHMWKAISELGCFVVRPRNRKRQEYIIEYTPVIEGRVQICSPYPEQLKTFKQSPIVITALSSNVSLENFDINIVNLQVKGIWLSKKYASSLKTLNELFLQITDEIHKESKSKILIILPKNYVIRSESKKCKQLMLKEEIHWVENHLKKLKKNIRLGVLEKPKEFSIGKYKYSADFHIISDRTDKTSVESDEVTTLEVTDNCWVTTLSVLRDVAYLKNYLEYVANMKNEIVLDLKIVVDSEVDVVGQTNDQIIDVEELSDEA